MNCLMRDVLKLIWWGLIGLLRSRASLEAEILVLRHQVNVLRRRSPKRLAFSNLDRLIFAGLYAIAPRILGALAIIEPQTVVRWHRAGFRLFWRWKSQSRSGRPRVPLEIRRLIREMSLVNLSGALREIHGELLKLGINIGQTSVAKYMARRRRPPSQGWKTFLRNHADGITSMDLFVVPTIAFRLLYGLLILRHDRRQILWLGVTAHPTAEWIARQLTEAFGWEHAPEYLIRDRDRAYGEVLTRRVRSMGIRDRPTSPRSPWQNAHAERLIGSIRRMIMSWCSASYICATGTCTTTTAHAHICLWARTRHTAGCSGRRTHSADTNSRRIAPSICSDLISDRHTCFFLTHELCGRSLVSSPLHEQVENFALAVDGAPKPELLAADHNGHLIEMPLRGRPLALAPKFSGEQGSELQNPAPHGLVGDIQPALGEQILYVAIAQGEAKVEPHRMLDDNRRKAVASIRDCCHATILRPGRTRSSVTVTLPFLLLGLHLRLFCMQAAAGNNPPGRVGEHAQVDLHRPRPSSARGATKHHERNHLRGGKGDGLTRERFCFWCINCTKSQGNDLSKGDHHGNSPIKSGRSRP